MDESYSGLPTSHLLGSVPAVLSEDKEKSTASYEAPEANMQIFPQNNGGGKGPGYQTVGGPSETFEEQPANNWRGVFNVASYVQYFNVDTDIVLNRLLSSLFPHNGDFFSKIDANPDLYGLIWISTTLVFVLASVGNCATYLMNRHTDTTTSWSFNVSYMSLAACSVYGYAILVPLAFYFTLKYLGANSSLIRLWCMWGYSLFIFIVASFLLLIPVEALRWIIIVLVGAASASFVGLNLKSHMQGSDFTLVVIAACLLQLALAVFFKVYFFP
ncbi:uncharacterized protein LOC126803322 isoform X2 [Argentina anserina]|uniref:uncharacterized protein LOC126803322 isoform X2 n=1 Tax=Argentina anserina TaxID=57926 RepID=UPI00217685E4|nr:uncharacterized protein LOC126803322 isoform X2 [Potentilla anserina]